MTTTNLNNMINNYNGSAFEIQDIFDEVAGFRCSMTLALELSALKVSEAKVREIAAIICR